MADKYAGMEVGIMRFHIHINCPNGIWFKKTSDTLTYSASLAKVEVLKGSAWRNGSAIIDNDDYPSFKFARAVCYTKNGVGINIKYQDEDVISTGEFSCETSKGEIWDRNGNGDHLDMGCYVDPLLMNMSAGATFTAEFSKGEPGSTNWLHAFDLRSSNPTNSTSNSNHVWVDVSYWYDPFYDYTKSTLNLTSSNVTTSENNNNGIKSTIITGKYDAHVFHRLTYRNTSNVNSIVVKIAYNDKSELKQAQAIPHNWCNTIPDASSGVGYVKLETFYKYMEGNKNVDGQDVSGMYQGVKTRKLGQTEELSFIFNVPSTFVPEIGGLNYRIIPIQTDNEPNEVSQEWVNKKLYVQNICGVQLHPFNISGSYGSKIRSISYIESTFKSFKRNFPITQDKTVWHNKAIDSTTSFDEDPNIDVTDQTVKASGNIVYSAYVTDSRGRTSNTVFTSGIPVITYSPPSFASTRTNRVTKRIGLNGESDEYDIAEDGTAISVLASVTHSQIMYQEKNQDVPKNLNTPVVGFQYRVRDTKDWLPSEPIKIESDIVKNYADNVFDPQKEYQVRFTLYDTFTKSINQPVVLIVDLASNECTMYWKRDGLGIGIGQKTQTSRHQRALEISPDWLIMHGQENGIIYYVPDIVFTAKGDSNTPKRKIGRIWLKEVD